MSAASEARKRAGYSVAQAAAQTGYSVATVRQCEKRSVAASFRPAQRLGKLYGCDPKLFLKQAAPKIETKRDD